LDTSSINASIWTDVRFMACHWLQRGLRDLAGSLIGRPHYLPVVGRPGDFAVLTGPEAWGGMQQLQAIVDGPWENKVLARVALKIPRYNPIRKARQVRVPTPGDRWLEGQHRVGQGCAGGSEAYAQRALHAA